MKEIKSIKPEDINSNHPHKENAEPNVDFPECFKCDGTLTTEKGRPCKKCNGTGRLQSKFFRDLQNLLSEEMHK